MIYLWFIYDFWDFPLFFIDFPKEFLEIFDFSLIFLEVFLEILDFLNDLNLFFRIFLRNFMEFPWNHKKIINKP